MSLNPKLFKHLGRFIEDSDYETFACAVELGADIHGLDDRLRRPIDYAAESGDSRFLRLLLEKGADPNAPSVKYGWSYYPLIIAALHGRRENVEILLDAGARIDAKDQLGRTAFFDATSHAHHDIMRLLVSRGADVNVIDDYGFYALDDARCTVATIQEALKLGVKLACVSCFIYYFWIPTDRRIAYTTTRYDDDKDN